MDQALSIDVHHGSGRLTRIDSTRTEKRVRGAFGRSIARSRR
ncbi:MAG: hypothetical protein QM674_13200 [Burkholderiaceae bacterium]